MTVALRDSGARAKGTQLVQELQQRLAALRFVGRRSRRNGRGQRQQPATGHHGGHRHGGRWRGWAISRGNYVPLCIWVPISGLKLDLQQLALCLEEIQEKRSNKANTPSLMIFSEPCFKQGFELEPWASLLDSSDF